MKKNLDGYHIPDFTETKAVTETMVTENVWFNEAKYEPNSQEIMKIPLNTRMSIECKIVPNYFKKARNSQED